MDGIILIDKEQGCTSFDIVRRVRRLLAIKKAGHAGTLDPFATGLLILLLGQGTKLSSFLMNENKVYLASVRLGIETDTLDSTGKIVKAGPVPPLDQGTIQEAVGSFQGEIEQRPPAYSALKYQGRRAYQLAREGVRFELEKRRVNIFRIELLAVRLPRLTLRISCSGGTYIRSLAADLGEHLGTRGHLESLRRLSSGSYRVEEACLLSETERSQLRKRIIPLHESLPELESLAIDGRLADKIRNGYQPGAGEVTGRAARYPLKGQVKLMHGSELIAIAAPGRPEEGKLKLVRVFPARDRPDGQAF